MPEIANKAPWQLPSFYIETLGCPKNLVDSRRMRFALLQAGFREAKQKESADIILINSCAFIQEAQEETIETTFNFLKLKEKKPEKKIGLIGCFVERFENEVKKEIPELDFLLGTGRYEEVPYLLAKKFGISLLHNKNYFSSLAFQEKSPYAFFRISEGCNRNCTFCVIPKIRGRYFAHDYQELERQWQEEKKIHKKIPIREAIIVSQDTISQGVDELEKIIEFFENKEEIFWIRLQYLFPEKRMLKLLDLWQKHPKLVSYLDMPIQHASPKVLKRMHRPSDVYLIQEILQKAREIRPNIEIRTSFIIGFPDETEEEYEELFRFLEKNPIEKLALFRYSHETDSPAYLKYQDTVPEETKIERINKLREFHLQLRKNQRENLIGQKEKVLVEKVTKKEILARREQDSPEIDEIVFLDFQENFSNIFVGDFVDIEITDTFEYDYAGIIVS